MFNLFNKPKPQKVGLVLGGGAVRGIAHIGVVKVLHKYNISIHCISGTSAGAIVGALYAAGVAPSKIEKVAKELSLLKILYPSFSLKGISDSSVVSKILAPYIGARKFSDLDIPFSAIATNLNSGQKKIFSEGLVSKAVQASSSYPGIFVPTIIDGEPYIDGCFSDNLPVSAVLDMGADFVIAVDVIPNNQLDHNLEDGVSIYNRAFDILMKGTNLHALDLADCIIEPVKELVIAFDIKDQDRLIAMGEKAAEAAIPDLVKKLGL